LDVLTVTRACVCVLAPEGGDEGECALRPRPNARPIDSTCTHPQSV